MNEDSASAPETLLSLALSFYRDPLSFQDLLQGRSNLPEGVETILLAASGGVGQDQVAPAGGTPEEVQQAAMFFIEQVLLAPNADYYRLLGLGPQATETKIREHYRLLMRLFHPDRRVSQNDWQAVYAARVTQAYNVLRRPQSRSEYDALRVPPLDHSAAPRPPVSIRSARRPPARAACWWRQRLPQYVLTGTALAAGLFVLQVYLSQGLRASRTVNPATPVTHNLATAETTAPETQVADRAQPLLNELALALQTVTPEIRPTNPPPAPAEALTKTVTPEIEPSKTAAPAPASSQPTPPVPPHDAAAAIVKDELVPADRQDSTPPSPVNTDGTAPREQAAALAEIQAAQPTLAGLPVVMPSPSGPESTPASLQAAPTPAENTAPAQKMAAVRGYQPPEPAPVTNKKPEMAVRETRLAPDWKPSPPQDFLKKSEQTIARSPVAPVLNTKPADHPPPLPPPPSVEERIRNPAEARAPVTRAAKSPQASTPPPPTATGARPPQLNRPNPPPISPAESSSLLGRFIAAYNQGDLGTMKALFGTGNPALNQYRDLFSRTAARQLVVTNFNWRFTPNGALGRGVLSLQLRHHGPIPEQSYRGSLELELGRQDGGRLYIKRVNHVLRKGPAPATPRTPEQSYGGNG